MNILLLSQFFSTTRGGGEYVFYIIAKKLAENNHKVWVVTNKIKGEQYKEEKNIHLVFVPPTLEYKGGLPPSFSDNLRYSINALIKGLKIIKKEKIDIIQSNNFAPAFSGSILSTLTSKSHITTIHDVFSLGGKDFWKKWAKQNNVSQINASLAPIFERLMKYFRYDCIHTGSEETKNDLLKFGMRKPIHVIPYSIDFSDPKIEKFNRLQFIFVGRLVFYKNLEVLIKAVEIARKKEPDIKLKIVGDGPYKEFLQNFAKKLQLENNIEFTGYVTREEKEKLISQSNAMVFPSLFEGFGLVILEAFAQNKPVIVSDLRPMSDIVFHEQTGFILNPNNAEDWSSHMLKLIEDPEKSEIMGKNGNKVLKEKYNPDLMYQRIVKMYENACKN